MHAAQAVLEERIVWLREQVQSFESSPAKTMEAEVMKRWLVESESMLALGASARTK